MFYLIIAGIWTASVSLVHFLFPGSIFGVFYTVLSPLVPIFVCYTYKISRCPNPKCRRGFSLVEVKRELVDIRNSTKKVAQTCYTPYNNHRDVYKDTYWESVPCSVRTYRVTYICPHCGTEVVRFEKERE